MRLIPILFVLGACHTDPGIQVICAVDETAVGIDEVQGIGFSGADLVSALAAASGTYDAGGSLLGPSGPYSISFAAKGDATLVELEPDVEQGAQCDADQYPRLEVPLVVRLLSADETIDLSGDGGVLAASLADPHTLPFGATLTGAFPSAVESAAAQDQAELCSNPTGAPDLSVHIEGNVDHATFDIGSSYSESGNCSYSSTLEATELTPTEPP